MDNHRPANDLFTSMMIKEVIVNAALFEELKRAIEEHLYKSRRMSIEKHNDMYLVLSRWINNATDTIVFKSASYTACVEFALREPITTKGD